MMDLLDGLNRKQTTFLLAGLVYLMLNLGTYQSVKANLRSITTWETMDEGLVNRSKEMENMTFSANGSHISLHTDDLQNVKPNSTKVGGEVAKQLERIESSLSSQITSQNPLFVLNLPNSGNVAMNRYFKCAGLNSTELGRFWTNLWRDKPKHKWQQLGKCIAGNIQNGKKARLSPLHGCGDFRVWSQMEYISKNRPKDRNPRQCLFPTLQNETLRRLFQSHHNATIVQVVRDPEQWAESLSMDMKQRWPKWCNEIHDIPFPQSEDTAEWVKFYIQHRNHLRQAVKKYPSLTYIEVDLEAPANETAQMLHATLHIEETCWLDSAMAPNIPKDVNYPIFVAALPKSGTSTTHDYITCGVGDFEGAHQWTVFENSRKPVTVGYCIQDNLLHNRNIFHNCGDNKHWSDIGNLNPNNCFYPTMQGGLEAMYESYPYGTIMNVIRDAHSWYRSASRWRGILGRWSRFCKQFPPPGSNEQDWVDFYHWHTHTVRQFAKRHPTMTYVEVKLESNETAGFLEESFGFDQSCWGHANVNKKK